MSLTRNPFVLRACLVLVTIALLPACSSDDGKKRGKDKAHLVETARAGHEPLQYTADRAGSLRARREVKLFNQEEGRVVKVLAHQGDRVRQGQPIVQLDARLLSAQLDKARAARKQAELDVDRLERLIPKKLVSEDTLARARTALDVARADERLLQTRVSYMTVRAPFTGEVSDRLTEPGDIAPKHSHLATVVDSSSLITDVQVSELLLPRLRVGGRADVRIDALGMAIHPGKILRIYPTIDPATRKGHIEVALTPVPKGARAGQFCRVTLFSEGSVPLVVPFSALRRDPVGEYVFILDAQDIVRRQSVRSGLRLTDKVEILEGLEDGMPVVTKGFLGLEPGARVKVVNLDKPARRDKKKKPSGQGAGQKQDSKPVVKPAPATSSPKPKGKGDA